MLSNCIALHCYVTQSIYNALCAVIQFYKKWNKRNLEIHQQIMPVTTFIESFFRKTANKVVYSPSQFLSLGTALAGS